MLERLRKRIPGGRITAGTNKGCDVTHFIEDIGKIGIAVSHMAMKKIRRTGYEDDASQFTSNRIRPKKRKLVEEIFGWQKTFCLRKKSQFVGQKNAESPRAAISGQKTFFQCCEIFNKYFMI